MKTYPRPAAERVQDRQPPRQQVIAPLPRSSTGPSWFWPNQVRPDRAQIKPHGATWARLRRWLAHPVHRPIEIKSDGTAKARRRDWPWRDFTPTEMGCRHCGEIVHWPEFMDALQAARNQIGQPFRILSAHRCGLHNARVGGAPRSQHLRLAVDIALHGHDPTALLQALRIAGFTGFGFYTTFIHADMGSARQWFGSRKARHIWPA